MLRGTQVTLVTTGDSDIVTLTFTPISPTSGPPFQDGSTTFDVQGTTGVTKTTAFRSFAAWSLAFPARSSFGNRLAN